MQTQATAHPLRFNVLDEQIAGLRIAAAQIGDLETVTLCEHALLGEAVALRRCILKIDAALAMVGAA
jgi:hypothetical protein